MIRLEDPATWPRSGDRIWMPWQSVFPRQITRVVPSTPKNPKVVFLDGFEDTLFGWQFFPIAGDRVIVTGHVSRVYWHHDQADTCQELIREEFVVVGPKSRPYGTRGFVPPDSYAGEFFEIQPQRGTSLTIAGNCLAVISPRYQ